MPWLWAAWAAWAAAHPEVWAAEAAHRAAATVRDDAERRPN